VPVKRGIDGAALGSRSDMARMVALVPRLPHRGSP
jgi:hypothetical protein